MVEDSELWDIVIDSPFIPTIELEEGDVTKVMPKTWQQYNEADRKKIEKNYKRTEQVKESKVGMLTTQYENFVMKEGETIHEMYTKFSSIINELRCLGESISQSKQVRKILRVISKSWERKVDVITEAKDLKTLIMDVLIGNLQTYKLNKHHDSYKRDNNKVFSIEICSK
ncbi:uncharacterized protein LOC129872522 [Solanum dulcamara]|uniref:uncharacterized protein LOC129872522 n=1 Tax=Solanum dulcamara TaxID=45834 RepID=UPI002486C150|nr:uncharacterized protein LOC129872522 [Solanum dulcamara]